MTKINRCLSNNSQVMLVSDYITVKYPTRPLKKITPDCSLWNKICIELYLVLFFFPDTTFPLDVRGNRSVWYRWVTEQRYYNCKCWSCWFTLTICSARSASCNVCRYIRCRGSHCHVMTESLEMMTLYLFLKLYMPFCYTTCGRL